MIEIKFGIGTVAYSLQQLRIFGADPQYQFKFCSFGLTKTINVSQGKNASFKIDGTENTAWKAYPLATCASVIYLSGESDVEYGYAHLHHAPAGEVKDEDFATAMKVFPDLGVEKLWCIYAHPGLPGDYIKDIRRIRENGVNINKIIEIHSVDSYSFGIDGNGRFGR